MKALSAKSNVEAPSGTYPYGSIQDNSGLNDGTPVNRDVYSDIHQMVERIMDLGGVTANGLPDNSSNGYQIIEALLAVIENQVVDTKRSFLKTQSLNHLYVTNLTNLSFVNISAGKDAWIVDDYNTYEINSSVSYSNTIESFGSTAPVGYIGYVKFISGSGALSMRINSTNAGSHPVIKRKGVVAADSVYSIVADGHFMIIRHNTYWEIINMP